MTHASKEGNVFKCSTCGGARAATRRRRTSSGRGKMSLNASPVVCEACRDAVSLNVRPRFAVNDLGNGCSVYSHIPADGSHGFTSRIKSADVQNLRIRELGKSVLLSAKIYISTTLALAVFHIVLVCAGKQMRRVDAVWVIAGMAYTQFSRIISGGQIKRICR